MPGQPRLPHRGRVAVLRSTSASSAPARRSAATYSLPLPAAGWHLVSLNSEIEQDAHSPQLQWLRQDLAARRFQPILAIWHRPRWGSGAHRDSKKPRWFLNEMYAARAELVLNGHAHHYERFAPQRPDQIPDPQGRGSSSSAPAAGS